MLSLCLGFLVLYFVLGGILFVLMYGVLAVTSLGVGDDNFLFVCLCSCILLDTCFFVYFVPHSLQWLCLLHTMYYIRVVVWGRQSLYLFRTKNRHRHWVFWMPTSRRNSLMWRTLTQARSMSVSGVRVGRSLQGWVWTPIGGTPGWLFH